MDSKYSVEISKRGQVDLEMIYRYILETSKSRNIADKTRKKIIKVILTLKKFPKRNAIIQGFPYLRKIGIYTYTIVYYINENDQNIYIVRILSTYQDFNPVA